MRYRVGTRGSRLSLAQTRQVIAELGRASPGTEYEIIPITTRGDTDSRPLYEVDRRGIFEKEVDAAVAAGDVDFAVHSLKDVPNETDEALEIACVPRRECASDILVSGGGGDIGSLRSGALVGTSSLRRAVQVRALRPDVRVGPIRGNVETRISRVGDTHDAIVLAQAGVSRLGLDVRYSVLAEDAFVPSPGQGALALVCRRDAPVRPVLRMIEHADSRLEADAERALSAYVESGCRFPVGARARVSGDVLEMRVAAFSADGKESVRALESGPKADALQIARRAGESLKRQGVSSLALNWREGVREWNR